MYLNVILALLPHSLQGQWRPHITKEDAAECLHLVLTSQVHHWFMLPSRLVPFWSYASRYGRSLNQQRCAFCSLPEWLLRLDLNKAGGDEIQSPKEFHWLFMPWSSHLHYIIIHLPRNKLCLVTALGQASHQGSYTRNSTGTWDQEKNSEKERKKPKQTRWKNRP